MTQAQRDVYMALLMAGREDEATAYRDKVEAASYDSARARANANTYYVDKHGKKIEADMLISIGGKASITRVMHNNCFCPWLILSSFKTVSKPWGRRRIKS